MFGYGSKAPRAWAYTRGAARVVGVDLTGAVVDGWLSRAELAALVQVCQDCGSCDLCTEFLARTPQAEALPGYCPNKAEIEGLRP